MSEVNHRILLHARPSGIPDPSDFVADAVPVRPPAADEVLLETIFLSIDPAMRSWMSEDSGAHSSVPLGEVMRGGGIARVLQTHSAMFRPGELVQARLGIAVIDEFSVAHGGIPGVRLLEIAEPTRFDTYVAVKSGAPLSPYATHFIKTLRAEMEAVGKLRRRAPRK